jgi:hypothetical protein
MLWIGVPFETGLSVEVSIAGFMGFPRMVAGASVAAVDAGRP